MQIGNNKVNDILIGGSYVKGVYIGDNKSKPQLVWSPNTKTVKYYSGDPTSSSSTPTLLATKTYEAWDSEDAIIEAVPGHNIPQGYYGVYYYAARIW